MGAWISSQQNGPQDVTDEPSFASLSVALWKDHSVLGTACWHGCMETPHNLEEGEWGCWGGEGQRYTCYTKKM